MGGIAQGNPDQKELIMSSGISDIVTTSPQRVHPHPSARTRQAVEPTESGAAQIADESTMRTRHSRRHVQQNLHHLDRIIRHAIKDAVREAGDLDHETVTAIRDLAKDFRTSLQDTFLAAGRGQDFDHAIILSGVSDAIVAMTDGLRALRGAEDPTPPKESPIVVPPPEVPDEDTVPEEPIPGGLLSVYV